MVRILCDIDSTVADWGKAYDDELDYEEWVSDRKNNIPRTKDQVAFNLKLGLNNWQSAIVDGIMDRSGFYRNLPEIPGAIQALADIQAADEYDVFLVTSPWHTNPTCSQDKLDWVREHLGNAWVDKVIITKDKTLIDGDYLIDDKPEIKGVATPRWQHIVFDQPYNQHITDKERLTDWEEALEYLDTLESEKPNANLVEAFKIRNLGMIANIPLADLKADDNKVRDMIDSDIKAAIKNLGKGEVRTTSSTGGQKGQKEAQISALDPHSLLLVAEVAGFGAKKYSKLNFMKGYDWSLSYDALQRHLMQFWSGEDFDEESGKVHLAHAAWHCLALISFFERGLGTDDRYTSQKALYSLQTKTIV